MKFAGRALAALAVVFLSVSSSLGVWRPRSKSFQITTTALPNGVLSQPYSASLSAKGGWQPYTWSLSGGSLPPGIVLSSTGALSGTPCGATGTWYATFKVTDNKGNASQISLGLLMAAAPLQITTTSLPNATVGTAYSAPLAATGGVPYCP